MIFKQNEIVENKLNEAIEIIDSSDFLTESEGAYYPFMVPIRENTRVGLNLIEMEDLVEYAMANGIFDANYVINSICEENGIEPSSVGFSVSETTLIKDPEMIDTVQAFKEQGFDIFINPISNLDPVYQMSSAIAESMINYFGTDKELYFDSLFESFINDEFDDVLAESEIINNINGEVDEIKNSINTNDSDSILAKKLAALQNIYRQIKDSSLEKIQKVKEKILNAIDFVKSKISSKKENNDENKESEEVNNAI